MRNEWSEGDETPAGQGTRRRGAPGPWEGAAPAVGGPPPTLLHPACSPPKSVLGMLSLQKACVREKGCVSRDTQNRYTMLINERTIGGLSRVQTTTFRVGGCVVFCGGFWAADGTATTRRARHATNGPRKGRARPMQTANLRVRHSQNVECRQYPGNCPFGGRGTRSEPWLPAASPHSRIPEVGPVSEARMGPMLPYQ